MPGLVSGTSVEIYGNSDNDIIPLTYTISPTSIDTGAGDDIIYLGSNATPGSNINGNVQNILEFNRYRRRGRKRLPVPGYYR